VYLICDILVLVDASAYFMGQVLLVASREMCLVVLICLGQGKESYMEQKQYKVAVVGGGPSGAIAARRLAEEGIDVALIEKNLQFDKPCGGGIFVQAFDEFDIPKELIVKYVDTIDIVSPHHPKASVDIGSYGLGIVHRQEFDARLRDMAVGAGARLIDAKVVHIEREGRVWKLSLNSNKEMILKADYVVAADGVNSLIRKRLLGETPSRVLTYYADIENRNIDSCQFWFGDQIAPKHYAWVFPHYRGIHIGVISKDKHKTPQYYNQLLADIGLADQATDHKGYFIPYWQEQTMYQDGVFYVGDSASLVLPFTYEGIYYAMRSGRMAAEAIIADDPAQYERRWREQFGQKFRFMRILQTIFLYNDWFVAKMVSLYRIPRFQRSVMRYWSGESRPEGLAGTIIKVVKALFFYSR